VVETVLGVQFEKLRALTNAHLGVFWQKLQPGWPHVVDMPALEPQQEIFGQPARFRQMHLRMSQDPGTRLRIRDAGQDRMIQVQNGAFYYNWVRLEGRTYPRYTAIKPEFWKQFRKFVRFVRECLDAKVAPLQWEVTYVNRFAKGDLWRTPRQWCSVLSSLLGPRRPPAGLVFEGAGGTWHFEIPDQRGRLHVEIQHGSKSPDGSDEALIMKLTARGPIAQRSSVRKGVNDGLDLGRATIVQAFTDLTSAKAHRYWGRQR